MAVNLTRGTKKIINDAIPEGININRDAILGDVCDSFCNKFVGDSLEYQLSRMKLATTNQVLEAIDEYMFGIKESAIENA